MRRLVVTLLVLLALPTTVAANRAEADLHAVGPVSFQPSAHGVGPLEALFVPDAASTHAFRLTAAQVEVERYEWDYAGVFLADPGVRVVTAKRISTFVLTDLHATFPSTPSGGAWGIDAAAADFEGTMDHLVPRPAGSVLGHDVRTQDATPNQPYFRAEFTSERIFSDSPGGSLSGDFRLKLRGPTLVLDAHENRTVEVTGENRADVGNGRVAWLMLSVHNGTLAFDADAELVFPLLDLAWAGECLTRDAYGSVRLPRGEYVAEGPGTFRGTFRGHVEPLRVGARLTAGGDLESASYRYAPLPPAPVESVLTGPRLVAAVAIAAAVGVALVAAAVVATRHRFRGTTPDECLRLSEVAAENERWSEALLWAKRARQLAPHSVEAAAAVARCTLHLGEVEEANVAYEAAAALGGDGDVEYEAGTTLLDLGHTEAAAAWLVRALQRDPLIASELAREDALARAARDHPALQRALHAARSST